MDCVEPVTPPFCPVKAHNDRYEAVCGAAAFTPPAGLGVLANDTSNTTRPDLFVVWAGKAKNGTLASWSANGSFVFVPDAGFVGELPLASRRRRAGPAGTREGSGRRGSAMSWWCPAPSPTRLMPPPGEARFKYIVTDRSVGANDSVNWPTGLGGKGNDGVAAFVKQTAGSIGYVEYVYARKDKVAYTLVQNKAGQFPQPDPVSFGAAAAGAPWGRAPGNYVLLINQPGAKAWPISGATFILVYKNPTNPAATANALKFFDWAYKNGDAKANQLDYVPMPAAVKSMIRKQWLQVTAGGKPVYVSH